MLSVQFSRSLHRVPSSRGSLSDHNVHLLFLHPFTDLELVDVHLASLRLQISMNCLMSETSEGILTVMC